MEATLQDYSTVRVRPESKDSMQDDQASHRRRVLWAAGIIGFALGGFFDGILLHQVLQWQHLFSLVPGERWRDIGSQILMDAWFQVLHYVIACVGLWLLWTARPSPAAI